MYFIENCIEIHFEGAAHDIYQLLHYWNVTAKIKGGSQFRRFVPYDFQ